MGDILKTAIFCFPMPAGVEVLQGLSGILESDWEITLLLAQEQGRSSCLKAWVDQQKYAVTWYELDRRRFGRDAQRKRIDRILADAESVLLFWDGSMPDGRYVRYKLDAMSKLYYILCPVTGKITNYP